MCIFGLSFPVYNAHGPALYYHLFVVWLYHINTNCLLSGAISRKKLMKQNVYFVFVYSFCPKRLLFWQKIQGDISINVEGLYYKNTLFLSDFKEI